MIAHAKDAEAIFIATLEKSTSQERVVYVEAACVGRPDLLKRVRELLVSHDETHGPLDALPPGLKGTIENPISERPGTVIGPYKLLQQIGEGGMGVVWMAEQTQPVQRKVALKVIKPGMDSHQVIARFEAERQALAMMDHVNIARVLDAGATEGGLPYFVMELVHGVPITKYCDDNHLTPGERLELFVPVCQAIQHAHQKGIIHRDIKPSNAMVTLYDGKPVPKVIDFGVAKAIEQKLTERTLFTQYGTMVGTLEYMSPEQAEMSALGVDTRSDIYSLGVLLYELLTGSTPLTHKRIKEAAYAEILRMIKEEEPPKPSTRLSGSGEALASISANRHTEPAKLTKLVRGELDWIVMKTLEKDRDRRYETANGLAMDVQRYLNDEAVQACPPSKWYRFRKFSRRNRPALTVGVLLALSLLVMVGGITAGVGWAVRDKAARDEQASREFAARQTKVSGQLERILDEVAQLEQAEKWSDALVSARRAQPLLAGDEPTADFRERVRNALAELEFVQQLDAIRAEGGSVWGDPSLLQMAVADRKYGQAFRAFGIDLDAQPLDAAVQRIKSRPSILPAVKTAIDDWVAVRNRSNGGSEVRRLVDVINVVDPDPWRQSLRRALASKDWAAIHRLAGSAEFDRQPVATLYVLGAALYGSGESALEIDVLRRAQWKYPGDYWINHRLGVSLIWRKSPEHVEEGIGYMRAAAAIRPESHHPLLNLGNGHRSLGRYDEAEACFRKAIELNPRSANANYGFGNVLMDQKKFDAAIASYRKAIELQPDHIAAHGNLGNALRTKGQLDEAIACFRKAIELDSKVTTAHTSLGIALAGQGKLDEAITCYRKAIELDPKYAGVHSNLGIALSDQGKVDEAIACYRKAIELEPKLVAAHSNLGHALRGQGKVYEALASYRKAIELDSNFANAHHGLGNALSDQGKLDEAIASYKNAIKLDPSNAANHGNLGNALLGQRKLDEAIACYRKAIELNPKNATPYGGLGLALYGQGKVDEAIAYYRKAIELDLKSAGARSNLGNALRDQGKLDAAIAAYQEALRLEPDNAQLHDHLAWLLATCPDAKFRDPKRAVELARKAVELAPKEGNYRSTLGTARYRAGDWKAAVVALEKSGELHKGGDSFDWFFLAMAHWQVGEKEEARKWYDRAIAWMEKNRPNDEELRRFRAEAAELLGLNEK